MLFNHIAIRMRLLCLIASMCCACTDASKNGSMTDSGGQTAQDADRSPFDDATGLEDAGRPLDMALGAPCEFPADCPGGDCIAGHCRMDQPASCRGDDPCPEGEECDVYGFCVLPCEQNRTCLFRPRPCRGDCPRHMTCYDDRCVNECVTDDQCGDGHCMKGVCLSRPEIFSPDTAQPLGPADGLVAGVGVWPLNYPIGVSMAGFIGREGPQTPYAKALGGSDRVLERQDVRALVLSTDEELLIVLRLPLAWSTDYLRTLTAVKLQDLTVSESRPQGINYLDSIVTVATHSHSQPGRFWHILPELGLGSFGYGTFSHEMVNRYAESAAQAIKIALDNLEPARFGWAVLDDVDPQRRMHANRRPGDFEVVDDRMMVWRIETVDGVPLAGLVNFAIHGTHMHETVISADVAGAIERESSALISEPDGPAVPILFTNGNAGNISPKGDDVVAHPSTGKLQVVGLRVAEHFARGWESAVPSDDIHLELVNRRIPVTYELLGYTASESEFRDAQGQIYQYGGYFCLDGDEPDGGWQDGALLCKAQVDLLGWPVPNIHKAPLSAIRLDNLIVTTLPGEPTSSLGLRLAAEVEMDAQTLTGLNVRAMNFGYSQDYHLYLMEPGDWWQGGYEAGNNWFGWRLGTYLAAESRALARQLMTPEKESNDTGIKPTWWPQLVDDRVTLTESLHSPSMIDVSDESLVRGAQVQWQWHGGHPGLDLPRITIWAIRDDEEWLVTDDDGFDSVLRYVGNYQEDHRWSFQWEMPLDLDADFVRAEVQGQVYRAESEPLGDAYTVSSPNMAIAPAHLTLWNPRVVDGRFTAFLNLPDGPSNDDGRTAFDSLVAMGTQWRHGILELPTDARDFAFILGGPAGLSGVRVEFHDQDGVLESVDTRTHLQSLRRPVVVSRTADGNESILMVDDWPSGALTVPIPSGATELVIQDPVGNFVRYSGLIPASD